MGGLYDLLETYRIQNDPRFAYEGLYQDPRRDDTTNYDGSLMQYPYGGTDADELQAIISSAFPQDYGVGSLFNPRVGRPEQSIYYNEPEPADPTSDFYQPLPGFINAPQNYYPAIRAMQPAPTSLGFDTSYGIANEEDEEQVESLVEEEPQGIAKLFQKIGDIYRNLPTPMNLIRSIGENFGKGPTYSRFSPGGTFRGGIYNIGGVNTPIQLANDFYDRTTGLNRFDRARNRFNQTRSLKDLFGASRTLAEFNNARKIAAAQKASGYTSNFMDRPKSERNYTGPSGGDNTGGDRGARGAADSFSNRSGMGRTGY